MRIAIIQEHIDLSRGGAETSVVEMARRLARSGLDVTLVIAEGDVPLEIPGVKIAACPVGAGSKIVRTIRFVAEADRYCREERFDIVHAVTPCFSCNVYQPRGGTYVETVERSVARSESFWCRILKRVGRRFNRRQRFLLLVERAMLNGKQPPYVAAVSEYVARQVRCAFPRYPSRRLRVIFNGVDLEAPCDDEVGRERAAVRAKLDVADDRPVLLFAAHNFKLKGLREALEALTRAPLQRASDSSDARAPALVVVGRDDAAPYRRLARRLRLESQVRFVGPAESLSGYYAAADLLVHPTWYDPCSRVVLEALGRGLPVVTTRLNGAAEIMREGVHGAVVESPRDTAELSRAIARALSPEVRTACRAAAPALREQVSMARHARELAELYREIAGRHP